MSTFGPVGLIGGANASFTGIWNNYGQAVEDKTGTATFSLAGATSVLNNQPGASFEFRNDGIVADSVPARCL